MWGLLIGLVLGLGACGEGDGTTAAPEAAATQTATDKAEEPSTPAAWTCASMCVERWDCHAAPPAWTWRYKSGQGATAADAFFDLRSKCEYNLFDNFWCDETQAKPALASVLTSCAATSP